jgi:hypothetical protein
VARLKEDVGEESVPPAAGHLALGGPEYESPSRR